MPTDVCFWHGYEPMRDGDYHLCGECWHVWRTQADFAADVRKLGDDLVWSYRPDSELTPDSTVLSCPLCAHDW
jgi:hypothetical protein